MSDGTIKSGDELVSEFLDSIAGQAEVDDNTLASVKTLQTKGKLTKTALLKSLQKVRLGDNTNDETESN